MKSRKMFVITGLCPADRLHEASTYLDDIGVCDIILRPYRSAAERQRPEPAAAKTRHNSNPIGGLRPAGSGKKGALRAHIDAMVRNGQTEITMRELVPINGKQTAFNLF